METGIPFKDTFNTPIARKADIKRNAVKNRQLRRVNIETESKAILENIKLNPKTAMVSKMQTTANVLLSIYGLRNFKKCPLQYTAK